MAFYKEVVKVTREFWYKTESSCVFCGGEQGEICPACKRDYLLPELNRCKGCGKLISVQKIHCLDCEAGRGPKHLHQVSAWGHYAGGMKEFILNAKFKAQPRRIESIAKPFAEWAIDHLPEVDGVIAVPMHSTRLAERGFNQAEVLASALHWKLGLPILQGIERVEPTTSQVFLSRQERLKNLKGAFAVTRPKQIRGRSVWLVDDVTTTGATLEAVAEALYTNGVQLVYGLCLAAGLEK